ncbi:MAG: DinB family protein [Akkermansiaceae bacterium]
MNKLIDANLHFLQQASDLADRINDSCYARSEPGFYNSSIGAHLRHCLEHYEAFAAGLERGEIDYDARERNQSVETETAAARERIVFLTDFFNKLKEVAGGQPVSQTLNIKMDCGEDRVNDLCGQWQASTLGRELQFLVSHTVHHFAMIRSLCVGNDTEICKTFGVAPSTLKHRELLKTNTA